eukprot:TRINITY_DN2697_c1_g3_i1.p1 TRINITY_DN2697_c1_g3~~TRINITY_DN2697_c1_g3_i1.p1  ORF type:complete len:281 (+),score=-8.39 TRINITY_DN2697_c1_g3_i1:268-1110(+)
MAKYSYLILFNMLIQNLSQQYQKIIQCLSVIEKVNKNLFDFRISGKDTSKSFTYCIDFQYLKFFEGDFLCLNNKYFLQFKRSVLELNLTDDWQINLTFINFSFQFSFYLFFLNFQKNVFQIFVIKQKHFLYNTWFRILRFLQTLAAFLMETIQFFHQKRRTAKSFDFLIHSTRIYVHQLIHMIATRGAAAKPPPTTFDKVCKYNTFRQIYKMQNFETYFSLLQFLRKSKVQNIFLAKKQIFFTIHSSFANVQYISYSPLVNFAFKALIKVCSFNQTTVLL